MKEAGSGSAGKYSTAVKAVGKAMNSMSKKATPINKPVVKGTIKATPRYDAR